ncbi:MAG: hypothetical protein ACFB8W_11885 [Elainellaceae cyanobacterium]
MNTAPSVSSKHDSTTWMLVRLFLMQGFFLSLGLVLIFHVI